MAWTYYITDRKTCNVPILKQIHLAIKAGVDLLQIREKDLSTRELLTLAQQARALSQGYPTQVLVNDRLDVALAANLHGIHLSQTSPQTSTIRTRLSKKQFLIGVSTHNIKEVEQAFQEGADFVTFGPIFATPSKLSFGSPLGISALKKILQKKNHSILALGGVNEKNYKQCLEVGARGIAGIRIFQQPEPTVRKIICAIRSHSSTWTSKSSQ